MESPEIMKMFFLSLLTFCLTLTSDVVFGQRHNIHRGPANVNNSYPGIDLNYTAEFKIPKTANDSVTFDWFVVRRKGDAFYYNAPKYFLNLIALLRKQLGTWNPPPILPLERNPIGNLNKECFIPVSRPFEVLTAYMAGVIYDDNLKKESLFLKAIGPGTCQAPGFMPILTCKVNFANPKTDLGKWPEPIFLGTCKCTPELEISRWTPFVYKEIRDLVSGDVTGCNGLVGAHCDNVNLNCGDGLECDGGECGGSLGQLTRGYGGAITFSDHDLEDAARANPDFKSIDDITSYLIRTSNSQDALGRDCDPHYWEWATSSILPMVKAFNTTNPTEHLGMNPFDFQNNVSRPLRNYHNQYRLASIYAELGWIKDLKDVQVNYVTKMAEYYDLGESCLNEFPRMSCVQKPNDPDRGLCECSSDFEITLFTYDYEAEGRQCVGKEGAVCTTVRGSGDHNCEKGLVCGTVLGDADTRPPESRAGPLNHYEIKICQKPKQKGKKDPDIQKPKNFTPNVKYVSSVTMTFLMLLTLLTPSTQV